MKRGILLTASAAGVVLLTAGWLDGGFAKRTLIDVDKFRHPAGKPVLLTIDPGRLEKATGEKFSASTVKLGYEKSGRETEIPFATGCLDKVDGKMRLSFVSPGNDGKLYLYFGGRNNSAVSKTYPDVLGANALNAAKYWSSNGALKATQNNGRMTIRQSQLLKSTKSDGIYVEQTFAVAPEFQGMPVTLLFDAHSRSKAMWPLAVSIDNMDAKRKIIGQKVCDSRWTMMQTVPEKPFHIRQEGKIDPRAKFIRIRLTVARASEARNYDVFGKELADPKTALPNLEISRLALVPGNIATLPGANSELYVDGVTAGTSALKLDGKTSPLYNNFPSTVWSQAHDVRNQDSVFFPTGNEGTAEFYLRFDELPTESTVIFDNGRDRNPSFLRLEYAKGKFHLKMHSYGKKGKNWRKPDWDLNKTIPADITAGKWNHLAITWSKTGVSFFINGKKVMIEKSEITPADIIFKSKDKKNNIAEYTCIGADAHRFLDDSGTSVSKRYIKGAVDELRVSKVVRYTTDFVPAKSFKTDADTCA
ncbi:MAG: LamG domain-containing protein, partial [Lentisphaeria bacterium]|nr:LamG domain-containing protein [Lentisphaeria bacterium]